MFAARLIALALGLTGAEGIIWFGGYPSWWQTLHVSGDDSQYAPDPDLGWRNREGQFDLADTRSNSVFRYTNWSQGRRATSDREPAFNATARDVSFFGDSYVQGYGLSNRQTFAWMVQAHHPDLAVSNFGTADYGTYQSYLAIAKYIRRPASVFYLFNGFHEGRNVAEPGWLRIVRKPPSGFFYPYADLVDGALRPEQSPGEMVWPLSRWFRTAALFEDYYQRLTTYPRVRHKREVTQALIRKINQTVLARGGKFTVIFFDMAPDQRRDYRQFVRSHAIRFIDCDHPELQDKRLRLPDGHPNEQLNRLLAHWLEPLPLTEEGDHERAQNF